MTKKGYDINIKAIQPTDDFYLQWSHIYWWQVQFNLKLLLTETLKKMGCEND